MKTKLPISELRLIFDYGTEPPHEIIVENTRYLIHDTEGVEDCCHAFYVPETDEDRQRRYDHIVGRFAVTASGKGRILTKL